METDLLQLLLQFPLLGIGIWWITRQDKRWDENNAQWRAYLAERNSKLEKALDKLSDAFNRHNDNLDNK